MSGREDLPAYPTFGEWSRRRYGHRVRKVMVNGGFTCPNRDGTRGMGGCIYCDNAAFSPLLEGSVREQAMRQIEGLKKRPEGLIVYFQPYSNTYGPPGELRESYRKALDVPGLEGIAIGTRPDCIDAGVWEVLEEMSGETDVYLEIGVQSAKEETLKRINRGHGWAETEKAFEDAGERPRIFTVAHLIIGLPGEDRDDMMRTAELTAGLKPHGIKLHHLHVVKGTKLAKEYEAGMVKLMEAEEYIGRAAETVRRFDRETVLHRLVGETMSPSGGAAGGRLIAPKWGMSKNEVVGRIIGEVRTRS